MTRPLSLDLRERIAAALAEGASTRAVAKRLGVCVATAVRIGQKQRSGQALGPGKIGGHRPFVLEGETVDWIRARLAEKGDLTIRALTAELAERGVVVTHDTVWRCVRRLGLSFKKNTTGRRAGWGEAGALSDTRPTNTRLTRGAWSSSTKPGSRPT